MTYNVFSGTLNPTQSNPSPQTPTLRLRYTMLPTIWGYSPQSYSSIAHQQVKREVCAVSTLTLNVTMSTTAQDD